MSPTRLLNLIGTITHTGANGEVWKIEQNDDCQSDNPGCWPRYYVTSNKGYCSNPFRSLIATIQSMLERARNADYDYELEKEAK